MRRSTSRPFASWNSRPRSTAGRASSASAAACRARQMIIGVPADGLGALPQPGVVPKLSLTPGRVTHAGGALGSHTDEILSQLLGMSGDEIAELRADCVV